MSVDSVRLNDAHRMVVDAEHIVRVAGDRHEAEAVPARESVVALGDTRPSTYRLPWVTLMTVRLALGVAGLRPRPLIRVASAPNLAVHNHE